MLYIKTPKGYFPTGRHADLIIGGDAGLAGHLVPAHARRCSSGVADIVMDDPAVAGVGSSVGRRRGFGRRRLQPRHDVHQPEAARRSATV